MIHQPLAGMEGTATDIVIHAEEFIRMKKATQRHLSVSTPARPWNASRKTPTAIASWAPMKLANTA